MRWILGALKPNSRRAKPPASTRPSIELLEERLAPAGDFRSVIGLDALQAVYPYRGQGYAVAVLDTGIDYNHVDLGGGFGAGKRVIAGYDFINNDADPMDDHGHGTHLAGIIGSSNVNAPGIAPGVNLIALKVLDKTNNGNWTAVENALKWVIANQSKYNIVGVNLSLGSGAYTANPYTLLDDEFSTLKNLGVFTAAAAGNRFYTFNSQPGLGYPSISPYVVSVGATWTGDVGSSTFSNGATDYTTGQDRIASFSQRSSALGIMAPGAWITSTWLGGASQSMGGTSMATAVVTGSAVLLHQAYDQTGKASLATQDTILTLMRSTGVTVKDGDDENDNVVNTGLSFKRLNLKAAMETVGQPNAAPVFNFIADQAMQVGKTIVVPLSASDANGEPLRFSVKQIYLPSLAFQLDQQFRFNYASNVATNSGGAHEKWLLGSGNRYYCILPNGELRHWTGEMAVTLAPASLIANFDTSYYNDPAKLWNAPYAGMPPAVFSIAGDKLSIRSPAYWVGTYTIEATVTDGNFKVQRRFNVTVGATTVNTAPVVAPIDNRTMSHSERTLTLSLSATDAQKDILTYSAQLVPINGAFPAVAVSLSGNQLTITPALSYVGTFTVQVSVSDGKLNDTKTFNVTVNNTGPTLGTIAPATMAKGQSSLTLTLPAADADGDALTFHAATHTPDVLAYQLNQQYGFRAANADYYQNRSGLNEKWLLDKKNLWYILLPNGKLHRWTQSLAVTLGSANVVASLDPKIHADPRLLCNAAAPLPPALTFSFVGNQMSIQRPAGLTGVFSIDVTVSDGAATMTRTILVALN